MATVAFADGITNSHSTQKYPLGHRVRLPAEWDTGNADFPDGGEREFVYIKNGSAATLAYGVMVERSSGATTVEGTIANASLKGEALGVPQQSDGIPAGYYGFVQTKGIGYWKGDGGNDQKDNPIQCDASGLADGNGGTAVAGRVLAWGVENDGGTSGTAVRVFFDV